MVIIRSSISKLKIEAENNPDNYQDKKEEIFKNLIERITYIFQNEDC